MKWFSSTKAKIEVQENCIEIRKKCNFEPKMKNRSDKNGDLKFKGKSTNK